MLCQIQQPFIEVISDGLKAVNSGKIVTFGISPTRAETGYGYLEVDDGGAAATDCKAVYRKTR